MCGRYSLQTPADTLAKHFQLAKVPLVKPRYNIAPSQLVITVRVPASQDGREVELARWGLIPSWAKDPSIGARMIIARAETVADKPAFRDALARRRCLMPADGYYEWQRQGWRKQPFYIRMKEGWPFAFAGLWERWKGPDGKAVETCALLTTDPSASLRSIHNRMPVILDPSSYDLWLDPDIRLAAHLQPLFRPYRDEEITAYPVNLYVNDPSHDDPQCLESSLPDGTRPADRFW